MPHHQKLASLVLLASLLGLVAVAFTKPDIPSRPDLVGFCFILGTLYAQVTVNAAWMAFGPFPFLWRLPLSLVGIVCQLIAVCINIGMYDGPGFDLLIVLGVCLLGQWFIAQVPVWGLGLAYSLRLSHPEQITQPADPRDRQFGIRELLIFTTIIAIILGIGRVVVPSLSRGFIGADEVGIFAFLAAAGTLVSLPLLIAGLLPRYAGPAVAIGIVAIMLATLGELQLMSTLVRLRGGPNFWHLTFINIFTAAWILAYTFAIRLAGYRLEVGRR